MDNVLLSRMLSGLLRDNDSVSLPGFGSFVAVDVPAAFSDRGFAINPPYRKVSFIQNLSSDDRLAELYSEANLISIEDAKRIIVDFVSGIRKQLLEEKCVEFPGFGKLRVTHSGTVFFVSDSESEISPDHFGLEAVSLRNRPAPQPVIEVASRYEPDGKAEISVSLEGQADAQKVVVQEGLADAQGVAEQEELHDVNGHSSIDSGSTTFAAAPVAEEAVAESTAAPVAETPVAETPVAEEAVADESPADETISEPAAEEPIAETPGAAAAVPAAEEAVAESTAAPAAEAEAAIIEPSEPSAEPTAASVTEEAVAEPAASVTDAPAAETPAAETPAAESPAEPSASDEADEADEADVELIIPSAIDKEDMPAKVTRSRKEIRRAIRQRRKKMRSGWVKLLFALIWLVVIAAILLGVFVLLAHLAPDFVDSILFTPKELAIINY